MDRKIKISKRTVDALSAEPSRYMAWDTELRGFGVKVSPKGRKTYLFKYRVNGGRGGRLREPTIGTHGNLTADQARDIARRWAAEVAMGGDPGGSRAEMRSTPTLSDLLDRYLAEHVATRNKPKTGAGIHDLVERLIRPALGKLRVADIERTEIARFHTSLSGTPYQANRALATLSKVFSLAETWGLRPNHSTPCQRIDRFKETSRERYLSSEEFARLATTLDLAERGALTLEGVGLVHVNPRAIDAVRLAIMTGARIGEILALRWEQIDWSVPCANLPDSKTGRKVLHLPIPALRHLEQMALTQGNEGFVIRGGDGSDGNRPLVNMKAPWSILRKAAHLEDVRLHDLRHAFASVAVASGMSLPVIGALLGHREVRTTQRYAHLASAPLQAAANLIAGRIADAMRPHHNADTSEER